jgi:hypothetical protein
MENINIINNIMINAIVFDLDETIGQFSQLYSIWETIQTVCKYYNKHNIPSQEVFNYVLDAHYDYMRPLIMNVFNYLKEKKMATRNVYVMIYTNNNGPKQWTLMIKEYIHNKLEFELFDNVICAFKVDGKIIEPCRTTYQKTYTDLLRCTSIPKTAKIFFIDDQYHEYMKHENIYYIKIKPYRFEYTYDEIISRIINKNIIDYITTRFNITETQFTTMFNSLYEKKYSQLFNTTEIIKYNKPEELNRNIDISVGKQIMKHLKDFFYDVLESRQSRKNYKKAKSKYPYKNRTKKRYFK